MFLYVGPSDHAVILSVIGRINEIVTGFHYPDIHI